MKFIIYTGNDEVIVTTLEQESTAIGTWFAEENGRYLEDYDRSESTEAAIVVTARLRAEY